MSNDYKLCPKCNNALDNNVMQCPYCGEKMWIGFWLDESWYMHSKIGSSRNKKSGWCWCWCLLFIFVFFVIPLVKEIFSLIIELVGSLFD